MKIFALVTLILFLPVALSLCALRGSAERISNLSKIESNETATLARLRNDVFEFKPLIICGVGMRSDDELMTRTIYRNPQKIKDLEHKLWIKHAYHRRLLRDRSEQYIRLISSSSVLFTSLLIFGTVTLLRNWFDYTRAQMQKK